MQQKNRLDRTAEEWRAYPVVDCFAPNDLAEDAKCPMLSPLRPLRKTSRPLRFN